VVLAGGVGVFLATSGDDDEAAPTTTTTTTTTTAAPTTTAPQQVAPLTGVAGSFGDRITHPAVFVKIDNAPQARPQSGLVQADIVFEERVEGDTTRLAAVFHSTDAAEIGPVRSTRSTDLLLAPMFGRPIFASSGGNSSVLSQLARASVVDVGHNVSGDGFRRVSSRRAPHNLYTSLQGLYNKVPDQPPAPKPVFAFRAEGEALATGARPAGGVVLSFGGAQISRFVWDAPSKKWHRYHGNDRHLDAAGVPIAPTNVVVMEINYEFSTSTGNSRPHGVSEGEGRALVFTAGNVIEGRWVRPTRSSGIQLLAPDGSPIKLTPGQTFVELPPPGGAAVL
jgi:hypothetical protein